MVPVLAVVDYGNLGTSSAAARPPPTIVEAKPDNSGGCRHIA
jgi:hypothetical protein